MVNYFKVKVKVEVKVEGKVEGNLLQFALTETRLSPRLRLADSETLKL